MSRKRARVAIVHYWLVGMRGGEKVLEQICRLFPEADLFTHVVRRDRISDIIKDRRIVETFIGRLPFAARHYQKYLPLMPLALEELDLRDYDLVLSSEAGPAKGVITSPEATHLCYCHSPMRYVWDEYHNYCGDLPFPMRQATAILFHRLRQWDFASAQRVDRFVANSSFVRTRIRQYYRRDADVVHPPVDLARFKPSAEGRGYYLLAGQLVPYKRPDIAIEAFRNLGARLVVAGEGSELSRLRRSAPSNVEFRGFVDNADLDRLYAECEALIFPGKEDFGIVPVEAMASGKPVIAFRAGGVLDTIIAGKTGVFFEEQTAAALRLAIADFEAARPRFDAAAIAAHAAQFSEAAFRANFSAAVEAALEFKRRGDAHFLHEDPAGEPPIVQPAHRRR